MKNEITISESELSSILLDVFLEGIDFYRQRGDAKAWGKPVPVYPEHRDASFEVTRDRILKRIGLGE